MKVLLREEVVECLLVVGLLQFGQLQFGPLQCGLLRVDLLIDVRDGYIGGLDICVDVGCSGVIEKSFNVGLKLLAEVPRAVVARSSRLVVARASGRPGVLHDTDSALRCARSTKVVGCPASVGAGRPSSIYC